MMTLVRGPHIATGGFYTMSPRDDNDQGAHIVPWILHPVSMWWLEPWCSILIQGVATPCYLMKTLIRGPQIIPWGSYTMSQHDDINQGAPLLQGVSTQCHHVMTLLRGPYTVLGDFYTMSLCDDINQGVPYYSRGSYNQGVPYCSRGSYNISQRVPTLCHHVMTLIRGPHIVPGESYQR